MGIILSNITLPIIYICNFILLNSVSEYPIIVLLTHHIMLCRNIYRYVWYVYLFL